MPETEKTVPTTEAAGPAEPAEPAEPEAAPDTVPDRAPDRAPDRVPDRVMDEEKTFPMGLVIRLFAYLVAGHVLAFFLYLLFTLGAKG